MNVLYEKSFLKDLRKLKDVRLKKRVESIIDEVEDRVLPHCQKRKNLRFIRQRIKSGSGANGAIFNAAIRGVFWHQAWTPTPLRTNEEPLIRSSPPTAVGGERPMHRFLYIELRLN